MKLPKVPQTKDWGDSTVVHKLFEATQSHQVESAIQRGPEFRVSSLPYCPLLFADSVINPEENKQAYSFSFYVDLGTTLHSLYQRYAAQSTPVELIGNWQCNRTLSIASEKHATITSRCTKSYSFCSLKNAKKQHSCPHKLKCKPSLQYEELTVALDGLSGHVDLLYKIKNRYILADIKSTGEFLFDSFKLALKSGYYPAIKYWHQIETYAVLLEKLYGIKIYSYAIVYMSRAAPTEKKIKHRVFARKLTDDMRKRRWNLLKWQMDNNARAQQLLAKPGKEIMREVWDHRPCKTADDYATLMKPKFFGKENCRFWEDGSCQSGKIRKTLLKQIQSSERLSSS